VRLSNLRHFLLFHHRFVSLRTPLWACQRLRRTSWDDCGPRGAASHFRVTRRPQAAGLNDRNPLKWQPKLPNIAGGRGSGGGLTWRRAAIPMDLRRRYPRQWAGGSEFWRERARGPSAPPLCYSLRLARAIRRNGSGCKTSPAASSRAKDSWNAPAASRPNKYTPAASGWAKHP
jgi:hypothetical protein